MELRICKVKVPHAFLGTQGFSAHKEGRYLVLALRRAIIREQWEGNLYLFPWRIS